MIDERIKSERLDAIQKHNNETVEPNYSRYSDIISQQKEDLAEKGKEIAELQNKNKAIEKILETIGLSHPVIKDAYNAIYALSTTSAARRFTSVQASVVEKAISLANNPSQRSSIAQWLLDQVWKAVGKSSTYSAWFRNNAYPETMTIANGDGMKDGRGQRKSPHQRKL